MTPIEIILGVLSLAGGAFNLSGVIHNSSKTTELDHRVDTIEDHVRLTENGLLGMGVIGLIASAMNFKNIADNRTAINQLAQTKADKSELNVVMQKVNQIESVKADKTSVDAINANVKLLSNMMHNGRMM